MIEGIKSSSNGNYFDNFWKDRIVTDQSKIGDKNANESKPIYNLTFIDMSEHEKKIDEHIHKKVFKKDKDIDNKIIYQKK